MTQHSLGQPATGVGERLGGALCVAVSAVRNSYPSPRIVRLARPRATVYNLPYRVYYHL